MRRAATSILPALLIMGAAARPGQADVTCAQVPPQVLESALIAIGPNQGCHAGEVAYIAEVSVERMCYDTGLPEAEDALSAVMTPSRTIRIRRGTEVEEVSVSAAPTITQIVDTSRTLDTINLDLSGVICAGPERTSIEMGSWRVHGRDAGRVFSAEGYFPTDLIWAHLDQAQDRTLTVGVDIPSAPLEGEAQPRHIAARVVLPLD